MKYIYIFLLFFIILCINYNSTTVEYLDNKNPDTEDVTQSCQKHFFNDFVYIYDKNRNNSSKTVAINNV